MGRVADRLLQNLGEEQKKSRLAEKEGREGGKEGNMRNRLLFTVARCSIILKMGKMEREMGIDLLTHHIIRIFLSREYASVA